MSKQTQKELFESIENERVRSILLSPGMKELYTDAARETLAREWLRVERELRELGSRIDAATRRLDDALAD